MIVVPFKYYLRVYNSLTPGWEYYYIDNAGIMQQTATPTPLPQAPAGWDGQTLKWERGYTYYGVFTNYSTPLRFVNDGAQILKTLYYTAGIEAECQLYIEKHTNEVATWGYAEYYKGDIDFSQFNDRKDYVTVSIMESGFLAKLKAKENSNVEVEVEGNADVKWVKMDGIDLQAIANFTGFIQPDNSQVLQPAYGMNIPFLQWFQTEGYANGDIYPKGTGDNFLIYNAFYSQTYTGVVTVAMADQYFVHNTSDTLSFDVTLLGDFTLQSFNNSTGNRTAVIYALRFVIGTGTILQNHTLGTGAVIGPSSGATDVFAINDTITLAPDEGLIFWFTHTGGAPIDVDARVVSFNLDCYWLNKVPTTYIPILPPATIGDALVANIDSGSTFASAPLVDFDSYFLTSGDALRNLSGSILKTNWNEFYNAMNCMFNTAFYYDKSASSAEVTYKYYVFDTTATPMDLGEVNNFEVKPLTDEMFAKLKIGYKPYSYDEINGKEEFNTQYEFQAPLTRVTSEKDLTSPYRADMYGIELQRANLTNKTEADKDQDNDIFWIHVDKTATGTIPAGLPGAGSTYYELYRDNTLTITGLISPSTAFNIDLSPKRRMFAHGYWIRSVMYPLLLPSITYSTSEKTIAGAGGLITDDGVTIIEEKANEQISTLPGTGETPNRNTIFYPLVFTFETMIPSNINDLMTNPYCEFTFTYKGTTYYGWLLEVSDEPSFTPKQTYKLIASPSNTLSNLINGL